MKLIWLTDIHLDSLEKEHIDRFIQNLLQVEPDGVLIGGDIGVATNVIDYLKLMEESLQCPLYFVLGNHDYYYGSIKSTRQLVSELHDQSQYSRYLPKEGIIQLTSETCLIGHGCWGDGRFGDFFSSKVKLNDFFLIEELTDISQQELFNVVNALGDEAAEHFKSILPIALSQYRHVIALTHVPPFLESTWHDYHVSNNEWIPHFSCKAVGEAMLPIMQKHPAQQLTVLSGHTHSSGLTWMLPNLLIKTGAAVYGNPQISEVIFIR